MTKTGSDALKRAARRRMQETGETYMQARQAILKARQAQDRPAALHPSVPVFPEPMKYIRQGDAPPGLRGPKADLVILDEVPPSGELDA